MQIANIPNSNFWTLLEFLKELNLGPCCMYHYLGLEQVFKYPLIDDDI